MGALARVAVSESSLVSAGRLAEQEHDHLDSGEEVDDDYFRCGSCVRKLADTDDVFIMRSISYCSEGCRSKHMSFTSSEDDLSCEASSNFDDLQDELTDSDRIASTASPSTWNSRQCVKGTVSRERILDLCPECVNGTCSCIAGLICLSRSAALLLQSSAGTATD